MIKAVFFDFDMTLVNTGNIAKTLYLAFCKHAGVKPTKEGFKVYMGSRLSDIFDRFSKNKKERKELFNLFMKIHREKMLKIKSYGKEIMDYLKNKKIKVIILSNTSVEAIKIICKYFHLPYDLVIGDEDMPAGTKKSHAIIQALKKLKLKREEAIYVGDHINDIKQGKKAGVRVISVTTGVFKKKDLLKYHPEYIISELNKLKEII